MTRSKDALLVTLIIVLGAQLFLLPATHGVVAHAAEAMQPILAKIVNTQAEPVPVVVQKTQVTTTSQGNVKVTNTATEAVPVAAQGTTTVAGTVGLSAAA